MSNRALGSSEAHARLLSVIQALPEGVIIVDADGEVETVNRRAEELTGRSAADLTQFRDDPPWRLFRPDGTEVAEPDRPIVRALTSGEACVRERLRVVRDDGAALLFEYSATPVFGDAGVQAVVLTFDDVTASAAREAAQRDFITNAAHELQTPIAAVTSAIEVLQAGAKEDPHDRDRFLTHIAHACSRLERLTAALLVLARAQALSESPRREVVAVSPLLHTVVENLPHEAGLEIGVSCEDDLAVVANRALLEQALANLGHNALKHTSGQVLFGAARVDGLVEIVVRDTGEGIAERDRERIFERFYRGETSGPGFGLGLAIASEAIKAIDGELGFDTTPAGTTFAIRLPSVRILDR